MALVEVRGLAKSYPQRSGFLGARKEQNLVVEDVSFAISRGETMGLVGESGSGKSTVARMVLGLVTPSGGSIVFDGSEVFGEKGSAGAAVMNRLRRRMQPVFQDPYSALNPRMRVREIIAEPLIIHAGDGGARAGDRALQAGDGVPQAAEGAPRAAGLARGVQVREMLRAVGLDESAQDRYPHEFSGGQRQRINIARALILRPEFLVLDEPVSALDVSVGAQIVNLLRALQRDFRLTYLFISHSMPLVRYLSTNIAVMKAGKLVEFGGSGEVCSHPRDPYTKALLAATPELEPASSKVCDGTIKRE